MFPQLHTYVTFRENLLSLNKLFGSFITAICYNKYVGTLHKGQPNKQMKINNLIYKARQGTQIPLQIYKNNINFLKLSLALSAQNEDKLNIYHKEVQ